MRRVRSGASASKAVARSTTAMVCRSTSLWRWTGSCSRARAGSSGRNSPARPVLTASHRPLAGSRPSSSLLSSSRTRSRDTIWSRSRRSAMAAWVSGVGTSAELGGEAGRPEHPQRVVLERHLRAGGGAQPLGGQVAEAAVGVDEGAVGQLHGHRVDGEVAPGQVLVDRAPEGDLGLARVLAVGVGAEGGDLQPEVALADPDGAVAHPLQPHAVAPAPGPDDGQDLVGGGVGGQVDVGRGPVEQGVAHRPADQVQLVATRRRSGARGRGRRLANGAALSSAPRASRWAGESSGMPAAYATRGALPVQVV